MPQNDSDAALKRHLSEKVMGWNYHPGSATWELNPAAYRTDLELDSWADAGMVLDTFRRTMGYAPFHVNVWHDVYSAGFSFAEVTRKDGPRAICEAVARATGWEDSPNAGS